MPASPDRRVDELARRQHGAFSRRQTLASGIPAATVDRRLAAGRWLRRANGVYVLGSSPDTVRQRLMVVLLDAGDEAVAGFRCAAALHRLGGFHLGSDGLEILVPQLSNNRTRKAVVRRTTYLPAAHRTVVDGIPCTTVARTLADLAVVLRGRRLAGTLDDALLTRRVTVATLQNVVADLPSKGRRGSALFRDLVAERATDGYVPTESELERRTLVVTVGADLPPPTLQAQMPWRTHEDQRVDFLWDDARLILEADGRRWHARQETFAADRRRDRLAARHGYLVVRVTWEDVTRFRRDLADDLRAIHDARLVGPAAGSAAS